jgi:hypothetical protein
MKTLVSILILAVSLASGATPPEMVVFKTKTCGCCGKWVDHMRANGFKVTVNDVPSTAEYRQKHGVPEKLQSCHTALVGGYTVEGHVPAAAIQRLLKEKPKYKGVAVPGMPMGSPGMEGPYSDAYSVLGFNADGSASVYQSYPAKGR